MATKLPTNATVEIEGAKTYIDWVQEVSNGIFMPAMLLGIFIILFMSLKATTTNAKAFSGASFICMIAGILLTAIGWMASKFMYAAIIVTAIGAIWAYLDDKTE
jgi:hypothetical protein